MDLTMLGFDVNSVQSILLADLQWYEVVPGSLRVGSWVEFETAGRNGIIRTEASNVLAINRRKD